MLLPILLLPLLANFGDFAVASPLDKRLPAIRRTTAKTSPKTTIRTTPKTSSTIKTTTSSNKVTSTRVSSSTPKPASTIKPTTSSSSSLRISSTSSTSSSSSSKLFSSSSSSKSSSSRSSSTSSTYTFAPSPWPSSTPKNVPPTGNAYDYGSQYDPNFPNMYRDGGGGVTVGGHNLMTFSDTYTTNGGLDGNWTSFVANTDSYVGVNASDLTMVQSFGSSGHPNQATPMLSNETYQGTGGRYCIWPSNSLIPYTMNDSNVAIGVQPLITNLVGGAQIPMYNTLVQVAMTASGPVTTRLVQALFYASEIEYGSFGLLNGPDGYTYLFAQDTTGIKAARVQAIPSNAVMNRTLYQYYNNGNWSTQMPVALDPNSNVFSFSANWFGTIVGPSSGEIFWSPYHNTYAIAFMDGFVDGVFQIAYSTTGQLIGPWTTPIVLYQPPWPGGTWNYAGHAYPGMDPSGATLTLSYTFGGNFINMVKVTWCNPYDSRCGSSQYGFNQTGTSTRSVALSTFTSSSSISHPSGSSTTSAPVLTPTSFTASSPTPAAAAPSSTDTSTASATSYVSSAPMPLSSSAPMLLARKVPVARRNPLTLAEWIALAGPCKLKYSGCNIIPTKIDANSNTVLVARNLGNFVMPVGKHYWGKKDGKTGS